MLGVTLARPRWWLGVWRVPCPWTWVANCSVSLISLLGRSRLEVFLSLPALSIALSPCPASFTYFQKLTGCYSWSFYTWRNLSFKWGRILGSTTLVTIEMRTESFHHKEKCSLAWSKGGHSGHVTLCTRYHFLCYISVSHNTRALLWFFFSWLWTPLFHPFLYSSCIHICAEMVACLLGSRCRRDAEADTSTDPIELTY